MVKEGRKEKKKKKQKKKKNRRTFVCLEKRVNDDKAERTNRRTND